jgi:hypothetical protein
MTLPFTIQIPVFNETRALAFSAFYFDRLGIQAHYVCDSQRTPEAEATLRRLGREPLFFTNDKPFIENGYESFAAASPTDWILRLDCDEVPSRELIEVCRDFVKQDRVGIAGFVRHHVLWRNDRFLTATTERFTPPNQRQWRLFNRKRVAFNPRIHTPGLHLENPVAAPPEAALYHLSWVFLTYEDRLKKVARYDDYGQPSFNRMNQLFLLEDVEWQELDAHFLRDAYAEWSGCHL